MPGSLAQRAERGLVAVPVRLRAASCVVAAQAEAHIYFYAQGTQERCLYMRAMRLLQEGGEGRGGRLLGHLASGS